MIKFIIKCDNKETEAFLRNANITLDIVSSENGSPTVDSVSLAETIPTEAMNFTDSAAKMGLGVHKLIKILLMKGFIFRENDRDLMAYDRYVDEGLFCFRSYCCNRHMGVQTLIIPKGYEYFCKLIQKNVD